MLGEVRIALTVLATEDEEEGGELLLLIQGRNGRVHFVREGFWALRSSRNRAACAGFYGCLMLISGLELLRAPL